MSEQAPISSELPATPPRWGLGEAAAGWVGAEVLGLIVGSIILTATGYAGTKSTDLPLRLLVLVQVPFWAGLVLAVWYAGRYKGSGVVHDFGLRVRALDVPVGAAIGLACQFVLVPLISWPFLVLSHKTAEDLSSVATNLTDKATDWVGVVLLVIIVGIGAPIVEELFFRGLLLRALERRYGTAAAVVLSGLIFGITHFELLQLPALTAFGIVLALLAVRTRRLGPGIAAHAAFNLVAVTTLLVK